VEAGRPRRKVSGELRALYGRSPAGDYALPKTLEILDRNGLKGVFFVEPLFAARFGVDIWRPSST
jgi:peptidoglycan/xylan/chitin deacetylase (PgdA/CDA1 family)